MKGVWRGGEQFNHSKFSDGHVLHTTWRYNWCYLNETDFTCIVTILQTWGVNALRRWMVHLQQKSGFSAETSPLADLHLRPYHVSFQTYLISRSLEHTLRAGFSACLCHFLCCSCGALTSLSSRRIPSLCSDLTEAECQSWPRAGVWTTPSYTCIYTHTHAQAHSEVLRFAWNVRMAKDLSAEKSGRNDMLCSPVCVCVRVHASFAPFWRGWLTIQNMESFLLASGHCCNLNQPLLKWLTVEGGSCRINIMEMCRIFCYFVLTANMWTSFS